jgi:hypothetical protein
VACEGPPGEHLATAIDRVGEEMGRERRLFVGTPRAPVERADPVGTVAHGPAACPPGAVRDPRGRRDRPPRDRPDAIVEGCRDCGFEIDHAIGDDGAAFTYGAEGQTIRIGGAPIKETVFGYQRIPAAVDALTGMLDKLEEFDPGTSNVPADMEARGVAACHRETTGPAAELVHPGSGVDVEPRPVEPAPFLKADPPSRPPDEVASW